MKTQAAESARVLRFEKSPVEYRWDSRARRALSEIPVFFPAWKALAPKIRAMTTELYWLHVTGGGRGHDAEAKLIEAVRGEVLADPLHRVGAEASARPSATNAGARWWCLEKRLRAGVTDNAGHVMEEAVRLVSRRAVECRSGSRLWLELPAEVSQDEVARYASEVFHNALIESVEVWSEAEALKTDAQLFTGAAWIDVRGGVDKEAGAASIESIDVRAMAMADLLKLSKARLWAFSKGELDCIQTHYRALGRAATDVEIEVLAQTWSEHCKHKIFAAEIEVTNDRDDIDLPGHVSSVFKTFIRGATREVPASYLKSVFHDNAGIISITPELDCAIKVETHNSPSALDPYGGALTGIVGVNRDILGAGMGAQPIANLDVFCVGPIDSASEQLPPRLHHPRRILEGVRKGVEDGGNKSGIPTVTGAVVHHPGYLGKPLVFCGTVGLLPVGGSGPMKDLIHKHILPGDRIVMAGGRIGKDGIHGATFSSLEMNESSPVSAVQLGDPLTQRRVWDFLLEARDRGTYRAVTDNGAGGLSSSIGELARMCGKRGGARMDVAEAKTKYPGLKPFELVVSESQERMSFAVPPEKLEEFLALAEARGVECSVLGEFEDSGRFHILHGGQTVANLDMHFLHEGLPPMHLKARAVKPVERRLMPRAGQWRAVGELREVPDLEAALPLVLALPNVRSRRAIVRQYDHEVQARTVRKPYGTPGHAAPGDGATLRLGRTTHEGVALGLGLAPFVSEYDPKSAAELALDEALRNAAVAGMDPAHAALVDNFCWPDPVPAPGASDADIEDAEAKLGALVVTCKRIYEGAVELRMPFVSGKDSMKNDYKMEGVRISVPPTLLITAIGKVHDVRRVPLGYVVAPAAGESPRRLLWVSGQEVVPDSRGLPRVDFRKTYEFLARFHELLRAGRIESAHDVSDGGWLAATAEMLFGSGASAELDFSVGDFRVGEPEWAAVFGEPATSFVLSVREEDAAEVLRALSHFTCIEVGTVTAATEEATLEVRLRTGQARPLRAVWNIAELAAAYHGEAMGGSR